MLGVMQKWTLGVLQRKRKLGSIYICYQRGWINYFISLPSSDYFSDYLRQRKDLAGDGVLKLLEKSSYGSMLFTSVITNSSRRDKELLEKETIPMETESRTGTFLFSWNFFKQKQNVFILLTMNCFVKFVFTGIFFKKKFQTWGKFLYYLVDNENLMCNLWKELEVTSGHW